MQKNTQNILKKKREEMGLSQVAFAKIIGVSQQHLDRYEKGYPLPLDRILFVADALHINKWDLLPDGFKPFEAGDFNALILEKIIIALENIILEKGLIFKPYEKARLIILLYEKIHKKPANDDIDKNVLEYTDFFTKINAS